MMCQQLVTHVENMGQLYRDNALFNYDKKVHIKPEIDTIYIEFTIF